MSHNAQDLPQRGLAAAGQTGRSSPVGGAFVPPSLLVLVIVEATNLVRVVIETISRRLGLVIVVAVVPSSRFLLGSLPHDVELLAGELDDLLQRLFQIHVSPFKRNATAGGLSRRWEGGAWPRCSAPRAGPARWGRR
jgi:hypothetical protein